MEWMSSPLGIALVFAALHATDYLLTVASARLLSQGDLRSRVDLGGRSLELNPVFQRVVDRGAWASRRFFLTLVVGAAALAGVVALIRAAPLDERVFAFAPELLLGVLVVTRLVMIAGHLKNLALFQRMLRVPAAAGVTVRYDRGTVFTVRRWSCAEPVLLCTIAYLLSGRPFFAGGVAGMLALVAATWRWERREARRAGAASAGTGAP